MEETLYDELKSAESSINRRRSKLETDLFETGTAFYWDYQSDEAREEDKKRLQDYAKYLINSKYSQNPLVQKRVAGKITFIDYIKPILDYFNNEGKLHFEGRKLTLHLPEEVEEKAKALENVLPLRIPSMFGDLDISKSGNYKHGLINYLPSLFLPITFAAAGVLFQFIPTNHPDYLNAKEITLTIASCCYAAALVLGVGFGGIEYLKDSRKLKREVQKLPRTIQDTITERAKYLDDSFL